MKELKLGKLKMRNSFLLLFIVLTFSCQTKTQQFPKPPPPPPNLIPPTPPPNFTPSFKKLSEIQINAIPHPFSLNGELPFSVWINGKRTRMSNHEIKVLAHSLNIKYKRPTDTAQIHMGAGWVYPLELKNNEK